MCPPGWTGTRCNIDINECRAEKRVCGENKGKCINLIGSFKCDCYSGFSGENCAEDIDECWSSPCRNQGVCVDGVNKYACDCPEQFQGVNCNVPVDYCESAPCVYGVCINRPDNFVPSKLRQTRAVDSLPDCYSAFKMVGPTTELWSFLEIFRIVFGQKIEIFKIALPNLQIWPNFGAVPKIVNTL